MLGVWGMVLAGAAPAFAAEAVSRTVAFTPGAHRLVLTAELPAGYEFNADAPQQAQATGTGLVAHHPELAFTDRTARVSIPIEVPASGRGEISVELTLYYCRDQKNSACLMDRRHLTYAIAAAPNGEDGPVEVAIKPLTP